MYAGNTNIFLKSNCYETLYEAANKELVNIDKWLLADRLFLNTDKTHYIIFRTPQTKPPSKKTNNFNQKEIYFSTIKNEIFGNNIS